MVTRNRRNKPILVGPIHDLAQAEAVLTEIAHLTHGLDKIATELNERIEQAKASAAAEAAPLQEQLELLRSGLASYANYNKECLFVKRRSVELGCGRMGFRRSVEVTPLPQLSWEEVLEKLKERQLYGAIRVKESPNKEILRDWSDEQLHAVDVQRVEKELFWYALKEENVVPGE